MGRRVLKGEKGSVLLEAMIFVGLIALMAAAILTLNLGGFIGSANVSTSQQNKSDAMSALAQVYSDLAVCDPNADGTFDVATPCGTIGFVGPSDTRTYALTNGSTSRNISVTIAWNTLVTPNRYDISITPQ